MLSTEHNLYLILDCDFLFLVTYFMTHIILQKTTSRKQQASPTDNIQNEGAL